MKSVLLIMILLLSLDCYSQFDYNGWVEGEITLKDNSKISGLVKINIHGIHDFKLCN